MHSKEDDWLVQDIQIFEIPFQGTHIPETAFLPISIPFIFESTSSTRPTERKGEVTEGTA